MESYFDRLPAEQRNLIELHLKAVMRVNQEMNLTRITDFQEGMLLHVEDSLSALPEVEASMEGPIADIGSGAGFPGIPLSVATGRKTLLVDMRQKKMSAVAGIVDDLGLSGQVETYAGRAELLARKRQAGFSIVTARALSKISVLLELASPLLKKGGRLLCYKSHVDDEELSNAHRVEKLVGMELVSDREFLLGDDYLRRILVFEKIGKAKITLPRQEGSAQKEPL